MSVPSHPILSHSHSPLFLSLLLYPLPCSSLPFLPSPLPSPFLPFFFLSPSSSHHHPHHHILSSLTRPHFRCLFLVFLLGLPLSLARSLAPPLLPSSAPLTLYHCRDFTMILFRASRFGPLSSLRSALCLAPRSYILSTRSYSNPPENIEQRSLVGKILHGSPTAQAESKQTHSAILARGKYVHEIQKHRVKPECVEEYIALVSEHYPRIAEQGQGDVKLTGSWMTSVGDQDTAVHIWEFTGYQGQALAYDRLRQDPVRLGLSSWFAFSCTVHTLPSPSPLI